MGGRAMSAPAHSLAADPAHDLRSVIATVLHDGRNHDTRCPGHDDRVASLSVGPGRNGGIVMCCQAGCTTESVLDAAGMTWTDVMPPSRSNGPAVTYDYTDEAGTLLYQVCRLDPKDFRQRKPNGTGWEWNIKGVRRVLYRLPKLHGQRVVYIVEGEKDADRLWSIELAATCNAGGAGKWRDDYAEQLRAAGAECIVILPDNDDPGRKHAAEVARSCHAAGLRVKVVPLPDLPNKGDVSYWLGGHTRDDLIAVVKATPIYDPTTADAISDIAYRRISDIQARSIHWLWPGKIARGKPTLVAGHPGLGKSQITVSLAAVVSRGGKWPVDRTPCEPGNVVILSAEDAPEDTIKPRLMAAGADGHRCYVLEGVTDLNEDGKPIRRAFTLRRDIDRLAALLRKIGDVALVIVDPLSAYLSGTDSHNNAEVRAALAPLADIADEHGAAIVVVSHLNKCGGTDPLTRVTGSLAFVAAARAAFIVTADKGDDKRRLFLPMKNNLAECSEGLAYRVESCTAEGIDTSRVSWEAEPVNITADEALNRLPDDEPTETDEAVDFLRDLLRHGTVPAKEAKKKARAEGIGDKALRRGRERLGIKPKKSEFSGGWTWEMPSKMPQDAQGAPPKSGASSGDEGIFGRAEI